MKNQTISYTSNHNSSHNTSTIVNTLQQFQIRLNNNINKVFTTLMSHSKIQQIKLPPINNSHYADTQDKSTKNSFMQNNRNPKSLTTRREYQWQTKNTINLDDSQIKDQKKSYTYSNNNNRSIGNKKIQKPKFQKRKVNILPKQARNNPFYQTPPIAASQINKGLINLLNKGIIAKDVDIGTAFERGQPPMKAKIAIMHHFGQKMVKQQPIQISKLKESVQKEISQKKSIKNINNNYNMNDGWAVTGIQIKEQTYMDNNNEDIQEYNQRQINEDLVDLEVYHWQFRDFKLKVCNSFKSFKVKYYEEMGSMQNGIYHIGNFLRKYNISIIFVDGKKILKYSRLMKKMSQIQIRQCFIGNQKIKVKVNSILNIKNKFVKQKICRFFVLNFFKMYIVRKQYLKHKKKQLAQVKIINWVAQKILHRRLKKHLAKKQQQDKIKFDAIQNKFMKQYQSIKQGKHFQIHIPNFRYDRTKQQLIQKTNTQITRIFNIKDSRVNIIYICPFKLTSQITNYYYKILQLGQIPNYKDRITFIQSDPTDYFKLRFNNSKTLYYSSISLKKIKAKIGINPAYIVSGYPIPEDIYLSLFLEIPLFNNYEYSSKLNLRNQSILRFQDLKLKTLPTILIKTKNQSNILQIFTKLNKLYMQYKYKRFIIKINNTNNSTGIATVTFPVSGLQQFYLKTNIIKSSNNIDVKLFYNQLITKGGIIQKYQNNPQIIIVSLIFKPNSTYQILGTFNKVAHNFINMSYSFPQTSLNHQKLVNYLAILMQSIQKDGYYGYLDLCLLWDGGNQFYFHKISPYLTKQTSSLFYFNYLMGGTFKQDGQYQTNVIDSIIYEGQTQKNLQKNQSRTFIYTPFVLHFGLSQIQIKNFFQLCRIQGISFDLQKKYGSTFILIDSLKTAIGLLTTAKDLKISVKLTILTLNFLLKQNSRSVNESMRQKEVKYRQKCNIGAVKSKLEDFMNDIRLSLENGNI